MTNRIIHATPDEVEALLAEPSRLTTFWRPVKPVTPDDITRFACVDGTWRFYGGLCGDKHYLDFDRRCPFGQPGDTLAVKETCRLWNNGQPSQDSTWEASVRYRADRSVHHVTVMLEDCPDNITRHEPYRWSSPVTMPRWAVRLGFTRPITGVQVKRVQSMTLQNVTAAGVPRYMMKFDGVAWDPMQAIQDRWQSRYANTPYAWAANPPAWAVTIGDNGR